jgi:hypothetical protein
MKSLFIFLSFFLSLSLSAQNFTVKGVVTDAEQGALPGAHIMLADQGSGLSRAQVSEADGRFLFDMVKNGDYELKISFLGFQEYTQVIKVAGQAVDLGAIKLREDFVKLETVQITEQALPAMQKGDTTEMNAQAYKTLPDASAEDLIAKMPTISVQSGKVQAQGEDVKQVLVDGKPFFGNDPTAALRSLPADVIDKIQVFDQQSEQAQFTGFQDGETTKTINIITKSTAKAGQFGKLYAGYGTGPEAPNRYQAGGQVNIFNKNQRISLIGMSNNINQQNFSAEDLLGVTGSSQSSWGGGGSGRMRGGGSSSAGDFLVPQQGGISLTHALGINYSDKWGKKTDVAASYFFNQADNTREQTLFRDIISGKSAGQSYTEENLSQSTNINHRFNARLGYQIDSSNSLIFRPQISWQSNDGQYFLFGETLKGDTLLESTNTNTGTSYSALNANASLLWRHKFAKDRRTFSVYASGGYAPKQGEKYQDAINTENAVTDTLNQFSTLDAYNWNAAANFDYTEPIGKNSMLMLSYRGSYQQDDNEREVYDFQENTQSYSSLNNQLSNVFSNDYITHRPGAGYNWRKDKWMAVIRGFYQIADLNNVQTFPGELEIDRTFYNFLPTVMLRYEKSRTDNFRLFYRTSTQLPSIEQMQNVLDNSNTLQLTLGNPNLAQSFQHRLFARYSKTNTEKSTVLFVLLSGSLTQNHIATSTFLPNSDHPIFNQYQVSPNAQLSTYENLDGYYNTRAMVTYGFPFKPLKLNLNVELSGNHTRTPGLITEALNYEALNYANNTNGGLALTIASNISDKVDFSLTSRTSYNWVTNTLRTDGNSNFLNQSAQFRFNWIIWKGITFRSDLSYQYFDGLSEGFDPNYWLWSMSIGKKVFKNDRGEINLSVFDLLKQNASFSRSITETYVEDSQTNVLQRFFMVNFIYNLRNFGQPPAQQGPPRDVQHWH